MNPFIIDISVLFMIIVAISFIIKLLRQPIILAYIISGILFSLIFVQNNIIKESMLAFSELGITFLLFLIGLELNFKSHRDVGKNVFITTLLQSLAFMIVPFIFSRMFGFSVIESIYITTIFLFSSTLLVAKWIEDKKDTPTLYGKIVLSTLIVQDLLAILLFTLLNFSYSAKVYGIAFLPLGGLILFCIAFVSAKYLLNPLIKFTLRYPELMFIFSIGVCFFFVKIASLLGYAPTIGAFIGGLVLANTIYKNDIYSRLKPLIIFFTMLFFVGMGFQLDLTVSPRLFIFTLLLCGIGLMVKPIVIYFTLRTRGYDLKNAIKSSLCLAQFSEFGIIIVLTGISNNAISTEIGTIAILSVAITMIVSSYIIKYDHVLVNLLAKPLRKLEKIFYLFPERKDEMKDELEQVNFNQYNFIFIGYGELDKNLFLRMQNLGKMLVIESDPSNIATLKKENIPYVYNSISNPYFFDNLNFSSVSLMISNLFDVEENLMLLKKLKNDNPQSHLIVNAKTLNDSLTLYRAGADYVLYSKDIKDNHLSVLIEDYSKDVSKLIEKKINDLERLNKKQTIKIEAEKATFIEWEVFLKNMTQINRLTRIREKLRPNTRNKSAAGTLSKEGERKELKP